MSVATKTIYRIQLCIYCPHYYYILIFTFIFDKGSAQTLTNKVKCSIHWMLQTNVYIHLYQDVLQSLLHSTFS
jgi:hypothetical protein